jgi:uncharacterized membrane protein
MAKKDKKERKEQATQKKAEVLMDVKFNRKNMLFFGVGVLSVLIGFIMLASGSIVLAPILLVLGYLVFFPLGILLK